jgi:hypothetical protein
MFDFFKSKKAKPAREEPRLADLDNQPLKEGDIVEVLRYGMGKSKVILTDKGVGYESVETGKIVTWHYMVDAATTLQKVKKLEN